MKKTVLRDFTIIFLILAAILLKALPRICSVPEFYVLLTYFTLYLTAVAISSLTFWKGAWILLLSGVFMGFTFELLGTRTGIPFGLYYYKELKPQVLGVAFFVPIAWGTYLFLSYLTARSFLKGPKALLMASSLMVMLDLSLDPIMTGWEAWVWITKTEINWYGIPWTNYLGWFIVSLLSLLLYRGLGGNDTDIKRSIVLKSIPAIYLLEMFVFYALATPEVEKPTFYALMLSVIALVIGCLIGDRA